MRNSIVSVGEYLWALRKRDFPVGESKIAVADRNLAVHNLDIAVKKQVY